CTLHRAENTEDPKRINGIFSALAEISDTIDVVLPLHPRTRKILAAFGHRLDYPRVHMVDPVGYLHMIWLLQNCTFVMTDSGGLQKEAYFFQKPCVTLRNETEWVELVEAGWNMLAGAEAQQILDAVQSMKNRKIGQGELYGAGNSADIILRELLHL
ncbi:UDP-N-acetyl glucosamine 2-epimerase, partial [Desulfobotulus sp. H1]